MAGCERRLHTDMVPKKQRAVLQQGDTIIVVPYTANADAFVAGRARVWSRLPPGVTPLGMDLAPDGKHFVIIVPVDEKSTQRDQTRVTFLVNFFDELKRRVH
jgi:hypothetical protein